MRAMETEGRERDGKKMRGYAARRTEVALYCDARCALLQVIERALHSAIDHSNETPSSKRKGNADERMRKRLNNIEL